MENTDKTVEDFLRRPRQIKYEIRRIDIAIADLRLMMLPGAIRYDKDSVQATPQNPMDEYVERLSDLEQRRKDLQLEYLDAEDQILQLAEVLDDAESLIIMMRFINCDSFEDIAGQVAMSERQVYRCYDNAIKKLKDVSKCQ